MTIFFVLHLTLGRKLDICERDDLFVFFFFALHWTLGGKLDICGRDDFFSSSFDFGQKTVGFKLHPFPPPFSNSWARSWILTACFGVQVSPANKLVLTKFESRAVTRALI